MNTNHPADLVLASLGHLDSEDVRLLWVDEYWDGLLEGMVEYRGARCLALVADWEQVGAKDEERRWVLYRLTPEQQQDKERWHALFVQHVGTHWDYTGARAGEPHPERFYGPFQARYRPPVLTREQAVGWFDSHPAGREA